MAAQQLARSRYRLPPGYVNGSLALRNSIPGYARFLRDPGHNVLGGTQTFTVASVPADLSTLIINAPNGQVFTFQYVYAGSVQTAGTIKIPLPASGGSSAAQVTNATLAVLGIAGGTYLGGAAVLFPWTIAQPTATKFELDFTVNGAPVAPGGTQATISVVTVQPSFAGVSASLVPSSFGPIHSFAPGS